MFWNVLWDVLELTLQAKTQTKKDRNKQVIPGNPEITERALRVFFLSPRFSLLFDFLSIIYCTFRHKINTENLKN